MSGIVKPVLYLFVIVTGVCLVKGDDFQVTPCYFEFTISTSTSEALNVVGQGFPNNSHGSAKLSMSEIEKILSCSFENGLCNWQQNNETDDFHWTRLHGSTPTSDTGPDFDYTIGDSSGFYLYIETSAPRKLGERAELVSPTIDTWNANYMCFSLWYHAYGDHLGGLNVLQEQTEYLNKTSTLWTFNQATEARWKNVQTTVIPTGPFKIIIKATVGDGFQGDIAIDDISVSSGVCPSNSTTLPLTGAVLVG